MIFRARLDIGWPDLAYGAASCLLPGHRGRLERRVLEAFPGESGVVCLSVRSAFDLLLSALRLPEGSEVLLSAVTVPGMAAVVRAHGLVPVPVDVAPETLAPDEAALRAALSPRSRVVVVAHLFGAVAELGEVARLAREHGLLLVEDGAQCYAPDLYVGHGDADVRLLSFGPIKTQTALGGGVALVRDPALARRMEEILATHPVQTRRAYAARIAKYVGLQLLTLPPLFALFRGACGVLRRDFDAVLRRAARSFPDVGLLAHLRRRPATPLLALLARRLHRPSPRLEARRAAGEALTLALEGRGIVPGGAARLHTHWVFPVLAADPQALMLRLRRVGFDATRGTSSLTALPPPPERPEARARRAEALLRHVLFVPAYPEVSPRARRRLADALVAWAPRAEAPSASPLGEREARSA